MMVFRRVVAPGLGLLAALVLFAQTDELDSIVRAGQLGPGFWPRLVLAGLALACLAKGIAEWRQHVAARVPPGAVTVAPHSGSAARARLLLAVGLILLYVMATPWLGFALATALFIASFMRLAGARSAVGLGVSAAAGTVALLYVFIKVVYLPLPKGAGPFESATVTLYRALGLF